MSINYKFLKGKVQDSLEKDEQSRNSDVRLYNYIIINFPLYNVLLEQDERGQYSIPLMSRYELPKEEDVCRIRRWFNNKGLYLPTDPEVIKQRKLQETEWHNEISDSVSSPSLF